MPYDAPDYSVVLWDNGKPYWKTASGGKTYIPPLVAAQMRDNPRAQAWAAQQGVQIQYGGTDEQPTVQNITNNAAPGGSLFHERGQWNPETGEWDQPINWGNIASLAVGGFIAAPAVAALAGSGAAGSGAAGTGAATSGTSAGVGSGSLASLGAAPAAAGTGSAVTGGTLAATPLATGIAPIAATAPAAAIPAASVAAGAGGAGMGWASAVPWSDIIGAGLSYVNARQGANAAQDASQAQIAAVNRALDLQQQQYNTSRGDFLENQNFTRNLMGGLTPYQNIGAGSLATLQRLTGQNPVMNPLQTNATRQYNFTTGGGIPGGRVQAQGGSQGGMLPQQGGMVTIQAPTGETRQVPEAQATFYESRGAKRI